MFSYVRESNRKDKAQELNDLNGIARSCAVELNNKSAIMLFSIQPELLLLADFTSFSLASDDLLGLGVFVSVAVDIGGLLAHR